MTEDEFDVFEEFEKQSLWGRPEDDQQEQFT